MKDFREDFLPYITRADGSLQDLSYELISYKGRSSGSHAHCELCWVTICDIESDEYEKEGYFCKETGCWICKKCFSDYKSKYGWNDNKH